MSLDTSPFLSSAVCCWGSLRGLNLCSDLQHTESLVLPTLLLHNLCLWKKEAPPPWFTAIPLVPYALWSWGSLNPSVLWGTVFYMVVCFFYPLRGLPQLPLCYLYSLLVREVKHWLSEFRDHLLAVWVYLVLLHCLNKASQLTSVVSLCQVATITEMGLELEFPSFVSHG